MREIILGLPGPWAEDNPEVSDHYTTKIGGIPDWPFPESCLGLDLLQCSSCRSHRCLISQVYAPASIASVKIEERVLYIFGCTRAECGSWRVVRIQKPGYCEESKISNSEAANASSVSSDAKWWDDLYSFDSEGEDCADNDDMNLQELGRALSEAATPASGSAGKNAEKHSKTNGNPHPSNRKKREVDASAPVLPCFYIYSQESTPSRNLTAACSNYSSVPSKDSQDHKDDDDQILEEVWEEEGYEYDKALNADRTYLKFKKQVDACPEQCFRYSLGGKPLLASGQVGDPGSCGLCGEARHYEMQLMPPLVYFLQEGAIGAQKDLLENWCWMTLIVYTCSKSCFQKADHDTSNGCGWTVAEEMVVAQYE